MKILITGASGFIGSAVLRHLLQAGHDMRVLLRENSDRRNLTGLDIETVTGDLTMPSSLDHAIEGCEALFHVAADYRLWVPDPENMYKTNVHGTRNIMLSAAKAGVKRIVYTSSVATLGLTRNGSPADETTSATLTDMIGHYKRSKFLAEAEVRRLVVEQNLPAVIVNPSTPIGPRDIKPTPTGQMIVQAASGGMPAYVDTGLNIVHVDDVAKGHLLAFELGVPGQRYILGSRNMTLKEILTEIAEITGNQKPRFRIPHNLILPIAYIAEAWGRLFGGSQPLVTIDGVRLAKKYMFFSTARAKRELGFKTIPVRQALYDAIDWFKQNGYFKKEVPSQ